MSVMIKNAGGTASGKSGKMIGGTKLSSDAVTSDDHAQFQIISKENNSSSDTKLFAIKINKLELGAYSVVMRLKVSDVTANITALNIKAKKNDANGELIGEYNIKSNMFKIDNEFRTLGFTLDYNNTKNGCLYLEAVIPQNSKSITVGLDYILVNPAYTSISSL